MKIKQTNESEVDTMTKITNVMALNYVIENLEEELPEDVFEKLNAMKASYEKKSANKKPTEKQKENEGLKDTILEVLTYEDKPMTVTQVQKANEKLSEFSNQKISSLIRQLVKAGKIERIEEKKIAYFQVA